jgi:hypothetical protein
VQAKHVVVDGSNLATEGRPQPSLAQLNEAVIAFIEEYPDIKVTVVVDATFGHRINKKEVAEFNEAVDNNELVAPPAGAVGRGDAFVLSIADKVNASVLSNDSYQEFHGKYPWLFDEGRLIGGKPVPHVGWVFVERLPVRGATSRRAMKAGGKVVAKEPPKASPEASKPMPIPKSPPPIVKQKTPEVQAKPTNTDDVMAYLTFVEKHPVGSVVKGEVDGFAANGVIVKVNDIRGYAPLRLLGSPAPRRPRDVFSMGEKVTLMIAGYTAARRSVDLGVVEVVSAVLEKSTKAEKTSKKSSTNQSAQKSSDKTTSKKTRAKKTTANKTTANKTNPRKADVAKAVVKKVADKKSTAKVATAEKAVKKSVEPKKKAPAATPVKKKPSAKAKKTS